MEGDEDFAEVRVPEQWEAGAYANASAVTFTPDEFTIDFIRMNPYRAGGVVVARIACSSDAARDLTLKPVSQLRVWAETVLSEEGGNGNGLPL
jgi:hypothetical protein